MTAIKFLITAYGEQAHLRRLCTTLLRLDPRCSITVQYDQAKDPLDRTRLPKAVSVIDTPHAVTWGDGSYLDAIISSMRHLGGEWDWLALISGQDYPIRPPSELLEHLGSNASDGILRSEVVPAPARRGTWTEEQRRYWFRHFWIPRGLWRGTGGPRGIGRLCRLLVALPVVRDRAYYRPRSRGESGGIGVLARHPPFSDVMPCRFGSDYFIIRRELVEDLLRSAQTELDLLVHFRHAAIPSESWFHTLLGPQYGDRLLPEFLTFSKFGHSAHPRLLGDEYFDDIAASRRFFARKFDESSRHLLDRIDSELLHLPPEP